MPLTTVHTVFRKGIPFEFPPEVLEHCHLRPNQKLSSKQFWKALVLDANIRLDTLGIEIVWGEKPPHG